MATVVTLYAVTLGATSKGAETESLCRFFSEFRRYNVKQLELLLANKHRRQKVKLDRLFMLITDSGLNVTVNPTGATAHEAKFRITDIFF